MIPPRYRISLVLGFVLASLTVTGIAWSGSTIGVGPLSARPDRGARRANELIIRYRQNVTPAQRAAVRARVGGSVIHNFGFMNVEHLQISGVTVDDAIARLSTDASVSYSEPNYVWHALTIPNDPQFPQLYGMLNTGQTGGTPGADIRATQAWDIFTGDPELKVGNIDTGVDYTHPDLVGNIWTNPGEIAGNGVDDDNNGYIDDIHGYDFVNNDGDPFDDNGHGTHTSGTIAASGNNGVGVVGVNWRARIVGIKFLDAGGFGSTAGAIASVGYAIAVNVRVTNNSWGGGPFSQGLLDAINAAGAAGQVFVAAAGNAGSDIDISPTYPASYNSPYILSVAATDHNDHLAGFSNYGLTSVDLGAPGDNILSTVPGGGYLFASGTSMATPHVTGAMAFTLGRFPGITAMQAKTLIMAHVDTIPALRFRTVTGGRLNLFATILEPDSIPPGMISNLRIVQPTSNTMKLAWTATGDDGSSGRAARYDIRYSTSPITAGNFDQASPATGPSPRTAGSPDTAEVAGLAFSTSYFFAIKAVDELGNQGPISNIISGTTLGTPDISVTPTSFNQTLLVGARATQTLHVRNDGAGTLDFNIPDPEILFSDGQVYPAVTLGKGSADTRSGIASALGRGGPDPFGYRWIDSDDAAGPTFNWVDITGVGNLIPLSGDDVISQPIPIGMNFPFYGQTYSTVNVCSNGFITFTGTGAPYTNQPLPSSGAPPSMIAPFWDDLVMPIPQAYTYFDGSRFIVQWNGVVGYSGGGPYSFEAILYPSGEIRYQYLSLQSLFDSQTIGIQNQTGDTGLMVAFNAHYLHDNLAVRLFQTSPWLDVTPRTGRVLAGQEAQLAVSFDANGLLGGDHSSELRLLTNDPDESNVVLPATLHVIGAPNISLEPTSLAFGEVFIGASPTQQVAVTNSGTDDLVVTGIATGNPTLTVTPTSFTLPPYGSLALTVRYSPVAVATLNTQVDISSNDPDQAHVFLPVTGAGVQPPDIAVSPESLAATVTIPGVTTQTLTVRNTGFSNLFWNLDVQGIASVGVGVPPGSGSPRPTVWGASKRIPGNRSTISTPQPHVVLPVVVTDPGSDGGPVDLIYLRGRSASGALDVQLDLTTALDRFNFGGVVSLDIDQNRSTGAPPSVGLPTQDVGVEYEVLMFGLPSGVVDLYSTTTGYVASFPATVGSNSVAFSIPLGFLSGDDGRMNVTGVVGTGFGPTDWFPDVGHGTFSGASWLTVDPDSGVVAPGQSSTLTVRYDTASLLGGQYLAAITFASNDPDEPNVIVPVRLTAIGVPDISADPPSLEFGNVFLGQTRESDLKLRNVGSDALTISSVNLTGAAFQIVQGTFPVTLSPGDSTMMRVRFSPTAVCSPCSGQLSFASNDPDENPLHVPLLGSGLNPPLITVNPESLSVSLLTNQTATRTLQINNPGLGILEWSITAQAGSSVTVTHLPTSAIPVEPTDPLGQAAPDNASNGSPVLRSRATYASSGGPSARILLYADAYQLPPGQQMTDRALQALGLGYTAFYGDPIGFGNTLTSGGPWDLVVIEHASFFELGQWWNEVEAYVQQGGHVLISTFDVDGSHSEPTTLWATLGVTPGASVSQAVPVYWWDAANPLFNTPQSVPQFTLMQNLYTDSGDNVGWLSGTTVPAGFTTTSTADRAGIVISPSRQAIVNSFVVSENLDDLDNDGLPDAVELLINEIQALSTVNWLTANPSSGTVGPGQGVQITLTFDATGLLGGDYYSNLIISSNAPTRPQVIVPTHLHVTGVPDLSIEGEAHVVESVIDYVGAGAQTDHHLSVPSTLHADGVFDLIADGDFGDQGEQAQLTIEGVLLGSTASTGADCTPASGSFPVSAAMLASFAADGVVNAVVQNSQPVDFFCSVNRHTLRLTYFLSATSIDFGTVFVGNCLTESLTVRNRGTDVLHITSIGVSGAAFTVYPSSLTLGIGEAGGIVVQFCPTSAAISNGTLTLHSDDPDTPTATLSVHGEGVLPPDISVTPTQIVATVDVPNVVVRHVTVRNDGASNLLFNIPAVHPSVVAAPTYSALELAHGVPDTRPGILGSGGPDQFGYRWVDSDEPNGPTFNWVDITGVGAPVGILGDDVISNPIPLGFNFSFYGQTFNSLRVCTNGFLTFTGTAPPYTNQPLPNPGAPPALLAPFWDDLFMNSPTAYYYNDGSRFIVSWNNIGHFGSGGPYTFEVILYPSGEIVYQYLSMSPPTTDCTVGIQNQTGDDGLTVAFNSNYIHNGLAVRFRSIPDWLSVSPTSGVVPPGQAADLAFTINTAGLVPDVYRSTVDINSNDPDESLVQVNVTLSASLRPDIAVDPTALAFGRVYVGQESTLPLTLSNTGSGVLTITSIQLAGGSSSAYHLEPDSLPLPGTLNPGQSHTMFVRFAPTQVCSLCVGTLQIGSDDPDENPLSVALTGWSALPPVINISPSSLRAAGANTLGPDAVRRTKTLTLRNTGGSDLQFHIGSQAASGTIQQYSPLNLGRGAIDPRPGIHGTGGPDQFGYRWRDSDSPNGPAFDWVDLTTLTQPLNLIGDDASQAVVMMGMTFPFYGQQFTSVNVCTNGFLSFTDTRTSYINQPLPSLGAPTNLIAPMWDDLIVLTRTIYAYRDSSRFIVSWIGAQHYGGGGPYSFQVQLYPDGEIRMMYRDLHPYTNSATIGIQNQAGNDGLTVAFNSDYLHDSLAVAFKLVPQWLTVDPLQGTLAPGTFTTLQVTMNAAGLETGDHFGFVEIASNDPVRPFSTVPCQFHVGVQSVGFDIEPNTINSGSHGRWVKGNITLPSGLDPNAVLTSSVLLQRQLHVAPGSPSHGGDAGGVAGGLSYRFDRVSLTDLLIPGDAVPVEVIGEVDGITWFQGIDVIRVRPSQAAPEPDSQQVYVAGAHIPFQWTDPPGSHVTGRDLWFTADDGENWVLLASGITGSSYVWTVPSQATDNAMIGLVTSDALGPMGTWISEPFRILAGPLAAESVPAPDQFGLRAVGASPARGSIALELAIPSHSDVEISVYDVRGRAITKLDHHAFAPGWHRIVWDARDRSGLPVPPGVYFVRMIADGKPFNVRLAMLK